MRKIFFLLLLFFGFKYPERPINFVSDFANVIDDDYERKINALLAELKEKTGAEIAVVTVETSGGEDFVMYGVNLFKKWGIGERGKDNGVLVINFIKERYIRIEVGYGLEGIIPDGLAGEIRDKYYIPYLRRGEFGLAHYLGSLALATRIADAYDVKLKAGSNIQAHRTEERNYLIDYLAFFIAIIILIAILSTRLVVAPGRRGSTIFWGGFGSGGGFSGGGFGGFGGGASGGAGAGGHY